MKVALVTTPAGARSGIGDYTRHLLPYLRERCQVELFVESGREGENGEDGARPLAELRPREHDQILYQLGNEVQHAFMAPTVRAIGGTVVLHDWVLFDLAVAASPALARGGWGGQRLAAREGGLRQALVYARNRRGVVPRDESAPPAARGLSRDRFDLPLNRSIVRHADAFLVHSEWMARAVREDRNARTPLAVVPHGAERRWRDEERAAARRRLGLSGEWVSGFLVTSLGSVQPHKRVASLLEALALARRERPGLRLLLAGEARPDEYDLDGAVRRLGLSDAVRATGYLAEERCWDALHAADLCVNLRGPSTGGASGGAFQAFGLGRGVIVSDLPENAELADECVVRVPHGAREVAELARHLIELRDDPERRARMEAGARRFVEETCHWGLVAARYVEALESFPSARGARRALVVGLLRSRRPEA